MGISLRTAVATAAIALSMAQADTLPRKGSLGVAFLPVPSDIAKTDNLKPGQGALVGSALLGLTGEKAGLKSGDVILEINAKPVSTAGLLDLVRGLSVGADVQFKLLRDGKPMTLSAPLLEKPRDPGNDHYSIEYSFVTSNGHRMRTIISKPKSPGKHPALFFIQGYSPISYDFNLNGKGLDAPILFDFADNGFVTLRVEKPGVGDSEGGPFRDVDFTTELDIYRQALKQLKSQDDVDTDNVFVFGHSMGGAFGPMVAAEIPVKGMIMYGIAARTWREYLDDILRYQAILAGTPYDQVDEGVRQGARVMDLVFIDHKTPDQVKKEYPELKKTVDDSFPNGYFNDKTPKFWGQLEDTNFAAYWEKSNCHVLALHGGSDFVTYAVDHQLVADIVNSKHPGWGKFETVPSSDHLFANWPTEADSLKHFGAGDFNPGVIKVMRDWVDEVMKG